MQPQASQPQPGGTEVPESQDLYRPAQPLVYVPPHTAVPLGATATAAAHNVPDTVSWEASEYIHRAKDKSWTVVFGLVVVFAIGAAAWFQEWPLVILLVIMSVCAGVIAYRQPRTRHYMLTQQGVAIDNKLFPYDNFRAFGVRPEDAVYSIVLMPVRRFMPEVIIYFAEDDGEAIVDILGDHLPMEDVEMTFLDNLMRRLHF